MKARPACLLFLSALLCASGCRRSDDLPSSELSGTEESEDSSSGDSLPADSGEDTGPIDTDPDPDPNAASTFGPVDYTRISNGEGGMDADIENGDRFGRDHDSIGDVDGDGVVDLIFGARSDDDGAEDAGAVYILFMNADGTVESNQKISALHGGFTDELEARNYFGYGVAGIGDYDGDSVPDVAVSAPNGAVPVLYILHLNRDGTIKSMVRTEDVIAQGLSAVGDIDQDGRIDLVAADPNGAGGGQAHLLFFGADSTLKSDETVTFGGGMGGFGGSLAAGDSFGGRESALLGDLDQDGTQELAIGAFLSDGGHGAIWIVSLDSETHQVVDERKIAPGLDGFDEDIPLDTNPNGTVGGQFGHALVGAGDLNGDGVPDLITSANQYNNGVGYVIYLNPDKSVKTFTRLDEHEGGFELDLDTNERFGRSMSLVDDQRTEGQICLLYTSDAADE